MMLVGMMESLARRMRHIRLDIRTQRLLKGTPHLSLMRFPASTLVSCVCVLVRMGSSVGVLDAVAAHSKAKLHQNFILFTVVLLYLTKIVLGWLVHAFGRLFELVGGVCVFVGARAGGHGGVGGGVGRVGVGVGVGLASQCRGNVGVCECHKGDASHWDTREGHWNCADRWSHLCLYECLGRVDVEGGVLVCEVVWAGALVACLKVCWMGNEKKRKKKKRTKDRAPFYWGLTSERCLCLFICWMCVHMGHEQILNSGLDWNGRFDFTWEMHRRILFLSLVRPSACSLCTEDSLHTRILLSFLASSFAYFFVIDPSCRDRGWSWFSLARFLLLPG